MYLTRTKMIVQPFRNHNIIHDTSLEIIAYKETFE